MKKTNLIAIISLVFLIAVVIFSVVALAYLFTGFADSDTMAAQGYGWAIIFLLPVFVFAIAYYTVITIISFERCKKNPNDNKWKIAVIVSLVLPALLVGALICFIIIYENAT